MGDMAFECYAKYGNRWSYKGVIQAYDSRSAARKAAYIYSRKVWRVWPEGSREKFLVYCFLYVPYLTGA